MNTVIQVGKGNISIDGKLARLAENRCLVLSSVTEQGPCQDGMCQIIRDIDVSIKDDFADPGYLFFETDKIKIAIDQKIYRSIDKGRENVAVFRSISGKYLVRGFIYLN
ncbi:MAG: hypothetical protein ACP5UV_00420 [Thermoplasmata archaeon]